MERYIDTYKSLGAALYHYQKDHSKNYEKVRIRQRYNLRKDYENELKEISNKKNILNFPDLDSSKQAFIDSIEIIKNLDVVITADTSTAHLSATLGKKTWILLPFVADWRWFLDESNSKWYENVTLYRSKKIDDWDSPFKMIERDLKKIFC